MMNEESLDEFLAREQNLLDHLTRKIHGPGIKFERLSAFGQHTIEAMARQQVLASDPDPELRAVRAQNVDLVQENKNLSAKLAAALRDNQDLWEENEEYKMREYDEENNSHRRARIRQEYRQEDVDGAREPLAGRDD